VNPEPQSQALCGDVSHWIGGRTGTETGTSICALPALHSDAYHRTATGRHEWSADDRHFRATLAERDATIQQLRDALAKARREHYSCEDCWYSCPKSDDGCCDDSKGDDCDCGADAFNALIDALLGQP
jgi:hypothetical protein